MSDDLAEVFGPLGFGLAAGCGAMALVVAAGGGDWAPFVIAAIVGLVLGLVCLAWSTR